jgi:hypothetical protein
MIEPSQPKKRPSAPEAPRDSEEYTRQDLLRGGPKPAHASNPTDRDSSQEPRRESEAGKQPRPA